MAATLPNSVQLAWPAFHLRRKINKDQVKTDLTAGRASMVHVPYACTFPDLLAFLQNFHRWHYNTKANKENRLHKKIIQNYNRFYTDILYTLVCYG